MLSDNRIQGLLTLANIETPQWHAILFFRQLGSQLNFSGTYSDKVTRIAKSALAALQTLYPNIKSVALIASYRTKSRVMPSFASDPETEMKLIRQQPLDLGRHQHRKDTNHLCYNAARAPFVITNQLLHSTMEGKRPILVSMGTNSISSKWERTYEFVQLYHTQYGELIIVIRMTAAEMNNPKRAASLRVLCPHDMNGQSFGIYTSAELLQDELCQGLVEWKFIMGGHREKAGVFSAAHTQVGGQRVEHNKKKNKNKSKEKTKNEKKAMKRI